MRQQVCVVLQASVLVFLSTTTSELATVCCKIAAGCSPYHRPRGGGSSISCRLLPQARPSLVEVEAVGSEQISTRCAHATKNCFLVLSRSHPARPSRESGPKNLTGQLSSGLGKLVMTMNWACAMSWVDKGGGDPQRFGDKTLV